MKLTDTITEIEVNKHGNIIAIKGMCKAKDLRRK